MSGHYQFTCCKSTCKPVAALSIHLLQEYLHTCSGTINSPVAGVFAHLLRHYQFTCCRSPDLARVEGDTNSIATARGQNTYKPL